MCTNAIHVCFNAFSLKRKQRLTISSCKQSPFSASVWKTRDSNELADFVVFHDSSLTGAGPSVRFFENLKMVNCQTRFCPGGPLSSELHGSCSVSFYVRFLFVQLNGVNMLHLALHAETHKLSFRSYIYYYIQAVCLGKNLCKKLQYLPVRAD